MPTIKELVVEYNKIARQIDARPVTRFASVENGLKRIAELKDRIPERFPLADNHWHAMNPESRMRRSREVLEMVFQSLCTHANEKGYVEVANAAIDGMSRRIWAGHLAILAREGRYRKADERGFAYVTLPKGWVPSKLSSTIRGAQHVQTKFDQRHPSEQQGPHQTKEPDTSEVSTQH